MASLLRQWQEIVEEHVKCPILMNDIEMPMITKAGHSYNRSAIQEVIAQNPQHPLDPIAKTSISATTVCNKALRNAVQMKKQIQNIVYLHEEVAEMEFIWQSRDHSVLHGSILKTEHALRKLHG